MASYQSLTEETENLKQIVNNIKYQKNINHKLRPDT